MKVSTQTGVLEIQSRSLPPDVLVGALLEVVKFTALILTTGKTLDL